MAKSSKTSASDTKKKSLSPKSEELLYKQELFYAKKLLAVLEKIHQNKKKKLISSDSNDFKNQIQERLVALTSM